MPLKIYGIYLAYHPNVDLRTEGLGRHLAEFLKGAQQRQDVRFAIACPSWSRKEIEKLCDAFFIDQESFDFVSPPTVPLVLSLLERSKKLKKRTKRLWMSKLATTVRALVSQPARLTAQKLFGTRSMLLLGALVVIGLPIFILLSAAALVIRLARATFDFVRAVLARSRAASMVQRVAAVLRRPQGEPLVQKLYTYMLEGEFSLMHKLIEKRTDIAAWYSPTAYWPQFHTIRKPRLMCVPDVVLNDFPTSFSQLGGDQLLDSFRQLEHSIELAQHIVVYSRHVKYHTLVGNYHVQPKGVSVILHGANRLDSFIIVSGFKDNLEATNIFARRLLRSSLTKSVNPFYANTRPSGDFRFLFYASQLRPNKNLLTLLRAYEFLLRKRFIGHKLILTCEPYSRDVSEFIREKRLENDVLFLRGLSTQELAACYHLADLAVNPSLSEGGFPFTFTEALSVETPVVMARIAVTEEIISDPKMKQTMLFDPYNWEAMAERIEWGIRNREELLKQQKPLYEKLAARTWTHVVDEYINILDRISEEAQE